MALLHCDFYSHTLGLSTSMTVILPLWGPVTRDNRPRNRKPYPVLWLLHGMSDDHTIWQRRTSIERYAETLGIAVVMPAVARSFYTDMASGLPYWTFISEELPGVAHSIFPLSEARRDNFVAGLSMGGYGAFKLALRHPERFAAAASLSGALDINALIARKPRDPSRSQADEKRWIFGDLKKVPGSNNDLLALAEKVAAAKGPKPPLYQWCGTDDFLYADNLAFRDRAQQLGLDLTYEEGPGAHEWVYWDQQIQRVLAWLPLRRETKTK
jgi:S-formylglutathione hydrolase FrmB